MAAYWSQCGPWSVVYTMKKSEIGIRIIPDEYNTTFIVQGEVFEHLPWAYLNRDGSLHVDEIDWLTITKDECKAMARLFDAVGSWL